MTQYYLYRQAIETTPADITRISVDYFQPDCAVRKGDLVIVFQSQTLSLLGAYEFDGAQTLVCKIRLSRSIKEILPSLSFVSEVGENMTRLLKKKTREITRNDYELLVE